MKRARVLAVPADDSRRMRRFLAFSALLALGFLLFAPRPQAMERRCAKVEAVAGTEKNLPALADKIRDNEPIRIVALGSSSVEGTPDMPRDALFASVMERSLARQLLAPVEVVNKGKGGETIPKMVERIERDVIRLKPDLVVWQLGVNDVLQMDGVDGAIAKMEAALEEFRRRDLPVVLVDLQIAPMVDRDKDTPVMQAAITEAGRKQGVMHFHRQAIMKRLVEINEAAPSELVQKDGLHMTQFAHFCTGTLLANQIARAGLMTKVAAAAVSTPDAFFSAPDY